MSAVVPIVVIAIMVTVNALFVAAEFATVGSRRSRVQEAADSGSSSAARLLAIMRDARQLDEYVAACQIGITLSSLVAGAYGQAQLTPILEPHLGAAGRTVSILIVLVAITATQVVLGELLPKTAALRYPETLAMATLPAMLASRLLFRPLIRIFNGSAFALMRLWRLNIDHSHAHVHSPEELAGLYRASAEGGLIEATEREMLAGVLNIDGRLVREIMTPRRRLVTVGASAPVGEALTLLSGSAHSRFPVSGDNDDIVGIVHLRDLFLRAQHEPDATVADIARPALAVGEVTSVPMLWRALRDDSQHCAIVVNEFGSIAGLVTLEDAIEEIFGELHDEFDLEDEPLLLIDGRVSARGDVLLSLLDDRFGLHITDDDIDTIGGLVWSEIGRLPEMGETVRLDEHDLEIRVDLMDGTAVERVSFDLPESR